MRQEAGIPARMIVTDQYGAAAQLNGAQVAAVNGVFNAFKHQVKASIVPNHTHTVRIADGSMVRMSFQFGVYVVRVVVPNVSEIGVIFVIRGLRTGWSKDWGDEIGRYGWNNGMPVTEAQLNGIEYNEDTKTLINSAVVLKIRNENGKKRPFIVGRGGTVGRAMGDENWQGHIHYGTGVTVIGDYVFVGLHLCAKIPEWDDGKNHMLSSNLDTRIKAVSRDGESGLFVATQFGIMRWSLPMVSGKVTKVTDGDFISAMKVGNQLPVIGINTGYILLFEETNTGVDRADTVSFGKNGRFVVFAPKAPVVESEGVPVISCTIAVVDGKYVWELGESSTTVFDRTDSQTSSSSRPQPRPVYERTKVVGYADDYAEAPVLLIGAIIYKTRLVFDAEHPGFSYDPWRTSDGVNYIQTASSELDRLGPPGSVVPKHIYQPSTVSVTFPGSVNESSSAQSGYGLRSHAVYGNTLQSWGGRFANNESGDSTFNFSFNVDGAYERFVDLSYSITKTATLESVRNGDIALFGESIKYLEHSYTSSSDSMLGSVTGGYSTGTDAAYITPKDGVTLNNLREPPHVGLPANDQHYSQYGITNNNGFIQKQKYGAEAISVDAVYADNVYSKEYDYYNNTPINRYLSVVDIEVSGFFGIDSRSVFAPPTNVASDVLTVKADDVIHINADTGWMIVERWEHRSDGRWSRSISYSVDVIKRRSDGKRSVYTVYESRFSGSGDYSIRGAKNSALYVQALYQQHICADASGSEGVLHAAVSTSECIMFSLPPGIAERSVYDNGGQINAHEGIGIKSIALAVCDDGTVTNLYDLVDVPDQLFSSYIRKSYGSTSAFEMTILHGDV